MPIAAQLTAARSRAGAGERAIALRVLGLALVRLKRRDDAMQSLQRATQLAPDDARFAYVYAVALNSARRNVQAIAELDRALARHPDNRDLLMASIAFRRDVGDQAGAARYAQRFAERYPEEARSRQLAK
jgi:Tfp pilus assembly protein PilF